MLTLVASNSVKKREINIQNCCNVSVPLRGIRNINYNKNGFGILPRAGLDPLLFAFSVFSRRVIFSCSAITQMFVVFFIYFHTSFIRWTKPVILVLNSKRRNVLLFWNT